MNVSNPYRPSPSEQQGFALWQILVNAETNPLRYSMFNHPRAALLIALADHIEYRHSKGLDVDPVETANWLRQQAELAVGDHWHAIRSVQPEAEQIRLPVQLQQDARPRESSPAQ